MPVNNQICPFQDFNHYYFNKKIIQNNFTCMGKEPVLYNQRKNKFSMNLLNSEYIRKHDVVYFMYLYNNIAVTILM